MWKKVNSAVVVSFQFVSRLSGVYLKMFAQNKMFYEYQPLTVASQWPKKTHSSFIMSVKNYVNVTFCSHLLLSI